MVNVQIGLNEASVTLNERSVLPSPYYLLKLVNKGNSSDVKIALVTDLTPTARVNKMSIEVVASLVDEDLNLGKIYLTGGDYIYEFYESSTTTLDVTGLTLLEKGMLRYDTTLSETDYSGNSQTEITYNG
jgi:hypothetical protein